MHPRLFILPIAFLLSCIYTTCQASISGLQEKRSEKLHDRFIVEWQTDFDRKIIDFWIDAATTGYVGFGLSVSGTMNGADMFIGGVIDSKPYLKDYHGVDHSPLEDASQDWEPLEISESKGHTYLHVRRKLDTCDKDDIKIEGGTMKLLYSIGASDNITRHELRGSYAVNILDPPLAAVDLSEYETINITQTVPVTPDASTIYWCTIIKRAPSNKSHVVAFKPKLDTADALKYTHHFNIYNCIGDPGVDEDAFFGPAVDDKGVDCNQSSEELNRIRSYCYHNFYAWSLGGRMLVFPENVGLPWGSGKNEYYLFEVHVDNQNLETATFETGVTIYHTNKTREIEAGLLSMGSVTSSSLMLPPGAANWNIAGHCSSTCTSKTLGKDGINIFNINLHAHISATKMRLRHFRSGKELVWIGKDDTYDFNFQENRPLAQPVKLLPGDHVTTECTYDSKWKSPPGTVIGGLSSYDEMCMVFAFYYPRNNLDRCFSNYPTKTLFEKFGITEFKHSAGSADATVIKPEMWANRTFTDILDHEIQWNTSFRADLQKELQFGLHEEYCRVRGDANNIGSVNSWEQMAHSTQTSAEPKLGTVGYPPDFQEYVEDDTCEHSDDGGSVAHTLQLSSIAISIFLISFHSIIVS